jgi:hypothetical protein
VTSRARRRARQGRSGGRKLNLWRRLWPQRSAHSWIRRGRWRRKAEIYATAAGARIGRLMVLTEQRGRPPVVSFPLAYVATAVALTPIEAGEDKLTVIVTTRFELTQ